ncbi:hypothetical protein, partial [Adlercreutzia sp. DFI.6.23]|uniref:hypothetical protein n=1 Tax=Adlercreutzia sp. DFI.6.23 TaxID=2963705 RepID=UPI00210C1CF4
MPEVRAGVEQRSNADFRHDHSISNLPFLIDPDTKLPVKAQELFPDFKQTTPENTPAYVCF